MDKEEQLSQAESNQQGRERRQHTVWAFTGIHPAMS